jgi:hypothetical protein
MKVCHTYELKAPTNMQMTQIIQSKIPALSDSVLKKVIHYIQGDLRKIEFIEKMNRTKPDLLNGDSFDHIFHMKCFNEDSKKITRRLLDMPIPLSEHNRVINETDRTIVALLWHENVVDVLSHQPNHLAIPFYLRILDNICFADYIDRITFQSQIWIFNEMSTFIKTFCNNFIFHEFFERRGLQEELARIRAMCDIRFTKILTKYSTEYSNQLFLYMLCQVLDMDKKDVVAFFQELRIYYGGNAFLAKTELLNDAEQIFEDTKICKLDIKRIYRYLDKNVHKETAASKKLATMGEDLEPEFEIDDEDEEGEIC